MLFEKVKGNNGTPKEETEAVTSDQHSDTFVKSSAAPLSSGHGNNLSKDVKIKGKIKLSGDISIDGKVEGEITTKGIVTLNQNAHINATIQAGTIIVHGKIEGNLDASDRIELLRSAEVIGDIKASILKVDAGATFIGNSAIGKASPSSNKPAAAPAKKPESQPVA